MVTCWRCGVDFNGDTYVAGAPCPDCQLDVPGQWLKGWQVGHNVPPGTPEYDERVRLITELHRQRKSDSEIAEALGISPTTVLRWRKRAGLPGHVFSFDEKWRDPEAAREAMRQGAEYTLSVRKPRSTKPVRHGLLAPNGRGFTTKKSDYDN